MNKDNNILKLFVGIPSGDTWHYLFGMSLAMMIGEFAHKGVNHYKMHEVKIDNHRGSVLSRSREKLANQALAWGASHLLFIDSDMVFPQDIIHTLMEHQKWVVAANCATKIIPSTPTARQRGPTAAGIPVYTDDDSKGLEKVWRVGTGVMLIDTRVFLKIPKPWFPITYNKEIDDYTGEDWNFVEKVEAAGIAVHIDHDISKHIGHCGSFVYTHDWVGEIVNPPAVEEGAVMVDPAPQLIV